MKLKNIFIHLILWGGVSILGYSQNPINKEELFQKNNEKNYYATDTMIINPHIKPHLNKRDYGNGKLSGFDYETNVNWEDYNELERIIKTGEYKLDPVIKDRSDINGDDLVNEEDLEILKNYIEGKTPYLPGAWDFANAEDRKSWFKKIHSIRWKNQYSNDTSQFGWNCRSYSIQDIIEMNGTNARNPFNYYSLKNNGRFNIPENLVLLVNDTIINGDSIFFYHGIVASLIGNHTTKYENWLFYEPQNNKIYYPELDPRMNWGKICIRQIAVDSSDYIQDIASIANFKIENGKANYTGTKNPWGIYERPAIIIESRDSLLIPEKPIYSSINNFFENSQVGFYPNPVSGIGTFDIKHYENPSYLEIIDVFGNKIIENKLNENEKKIDFSSFKKGMYFYRITDNDKIIYVGKIIKN